MEFAARSAGKRIGATLAVMKLAHITTATANVLPRVRRGWAALGTSPARLIVFGRRVTPAC